jgi:hypothetical protein
MLNQMMEAELVSEMLVFSSTMTWLITQVGFYTMLTEFWVAQSIFLLLVLDHGTTLNADHYYTTLRHMKDAIWMKCPDFITENVVLLQNKTCPLQLMSQCNSWCSFTWNAFPIHHTVQISHLTASTSLDHGCTTSKDNTSDVMMW